MAEDLFGIDVYVGPDDLDPTGRDASGLELVEADVIHRLTTDQIDLVDSPNGVVDFGINVRRWVGEAIRPEDASAKNPLVDEVLHRIEGVASVNVNVAVASPGTAFTNGGNVDLTVDIIITTTTGEVLSRTLGISSITVAFLAQGT